MTQKVIVLMFGHRSLVGKDTSAEYLRQYDWSRIAFADKLKSTVADLYGFSHEQMHGSLKDVPDERYSNLIDAPFNSQCGLQKLYPDHYKTLVATYLTPRRILQIFGQDQRKIFPDIWAQYVFNQIDTMRSLSSNPCQVFKYVITDFRFKNEFEVAKKWSQLQIDGPVKVDKYIFPIKIERDIIAKSGSNDISEHDLDDFSDWYATIDNNGTLNDLQDRICGLARSFSINLEFGY